MSDSDYGELRFDAQRLAAHRRDGGLIRFTRNERALLACFQQAPQRLLSRNQLLAALGTDADISERNVDYIVNRLRAKLGDSAREPRYIRTQYGEGYMWVAASAGAVASHAFIALGPTGGHQTGSAASRYLHELRARLAASLGPGRGIVLTGGTPRAAEQQAEFIVDAGLYDEQGMLRGVLVLRHGRTQRMLASLRVARPLTNAVADDMAAQLTAAIWRELATNAPGGAPGPSDEPAWVRLVAAERRLSTGVADQLCLGEKQLAQQVATAGAAPGLLLEQAVLKLARQIIGLGRDGTMESPLREAENDAIETLLMAALPGVQDDPVAMLSAAKILLGLGPAQRSLAETIVDAHLENGPAIATAMALRAQIRMYRGDIDSALRIYDQCLAHTAPHSEFHIYLLVLKIIGLLAQGKQAEVAAVATELHVIRPETWLHINPTLYAVDGDAHAQGLEDARLASHDPARMRERVAHLWHLTARLFDQPCHRAEVMRCLVSNARALHGDAGINDEVRRELPGIGLG